MERSVTTLSKDPHGDVDEPQFIDASKLVSKDAKVSSIKDMLLLTGLADNTTSRLLDNNILVTMLRFIQ